MKKIIFLVCGLILSVISASAQKDAMTIGANLSTATYNSAFGLGFKYQYNLTDPLRFAGSFDYFFEKDNLKNWDLNFDAHYLFTFNDNFHIYPLAGLNFSSWKTTVLGISDTSSKFGVNLGAGAQYDFNDFLSAFFEGKAQFIDDFNQGVFTFGISMRFK